MTLNKFANIVPPSQPHTPAKFSFNASICGLNQKTRKTLKSMADAEPTILVFPTLATLQEAEDFLTEASTDHYAVYSKADLIDESVQETAKEYLDYILAGSMKHLLLTHVTFFNLSAELNRGYIMCGSYHDIPMAVIIDEAPEFVFNYINTVVGADAIRTIYQHVQFVPTAKTGVCEIVTKGNVTTLQNWASNKSKDETVNNSFLKTFAGFVLDETVITYIAKETINDLCNHIRAAQEKPFSVVTVPNTKLLNMWKSVHILGSHFEQSEYATAMRLNGMDVDVFHRERDADGVYPNSERLTIKYYTPEGDGKSPRNWSASLGKKSSTINRSSNNSNVHKAMAKLKDPMLWVGKKSERPSLLKLLGDKEYSHDGDYSECQNLLVTQTHGVNKLRHYQHAAFIGSRNLPLSITSLLRLLGMPPGALDFARSALAMYQFVMRTNLRVIGSNLQVTLHVPDLRAADFLKTMFPKAKVEFENFGVRLDKYIPTGKPPGAPEKSHGEFNKKEWHAEQQWLNRNMIKGKANELNAKKQKRFNTNIIYLIKQK